MKNSIPPLVTFYDKGNDIMMYIHFPDELLTDGKTIVRTNLSDKEVLRNSVYLGERLAAELLYNYFQHFDRIKISSNSMGLKLNVENENIQDLIFESRKKQKKVRESIIKKRKSKFWLLLLPFEIAASMEYNHLVNREQRMKNFIKDKVLGIIKKELDQKR